MNAKERMIADEQQKMKGYFEHQRKTTAKRKHQAKRGTVDEYERDYERRSTMDIGDIDPEFFSLK